jgi:hypothetical protein
MLQVYRTVITNQFRSRWSTNTFFFLVDNVSGSPGHRIASAINLSYGVTTDWLFYYSSLITEHAFIRRMSTWLIRPESSANAYNAFGPTEFPGRWLGDCADNFLSANLKYTFDGDLTGKHQNRIGPIGEGATQANGWFPLFVLTAEAFFVEHLAAHSLDTGDTAQACINHETSGGTLIERCSLAWPPGRQKNRRYVP